MIRMLPSVKSPRIGWSVSGFRCADEMAVANETAKTMIENRNNLVFMKALLLNSLSARTGECEQTIKKCEVTQEGCYRTASGSERMLARKLCPGPGRYRSRFCIRDSRQRFRNATRSFFIILRAASNSPSLLP